MLQNYLEKKDFINLENYCHEQIAAGNASDEILFNLSLACYEQAKHVDALSYIQKALAHNPVNINPDLYALQAASQTVLGRYDEALESCLKGCRLTSNSSYFLMNAATVCQKAGRFDEAVEFYEQTLAARPLELQAHLQLATTYTLAGKHIQAQRYCLQVLELFPDCVEFYNILSESYLKSGHLEMALSYCEKGLALKEEHPFLWLRRGLLFSYLLRFEDADAAFSRAIDLQGDVISAYFSGASLSGSLNSRLLYLEMAHETADRCNWRFWDQYPKVLTDYLALSKTHEISHALAFRILSRPVPPYLRVSLMRRISNAVSDSVTKLKVIPYKHNAVSRPQLRIGYISADFYLHPTSVLTRQIYRLHDRLKFKIYAYSLVGKEREDAYQKEIASNCDVFRDVSAISAVGIADIINQDEIDILVDLGEYATSDGKLEVLALRPAPIQINYLAFMATTGADFIDYALVDHFVSPKNEDWSEQLLRVPNSLYTYDNEIDHSPTKMHRKDYGLPEAGIVFCCLNNDYKIEPEIFSVWMNILQALPGSVLWLLGSNQDVRTNLGNAAEKSGIDKKRLIFAGREPIEKHLKRYQLADIFLDTYWFNGHTTALEALWQGLPVITRRGDVTSSRVAASFLEVLGMPELVAVNYDEYKQKAIYYATHHHARATLKNKLMTNKKTSPLFNTALTVKQIELAYEMVWSRYTNNLKPRHIDIPAIPVLNW